MDPRRSERLSGIIREELDEMIAYELSDPRIDAAGVGEVTVSPDARKAQVRVLMTGDKKSQEETIAALNGARAYIRRQLAHRLDLFRIPELHFEPAVSAELGGRLEHLLKRVRKGRPRESQGDPQPQVSDNVGTSEKNPIE